MKIFDDKEKLLNQVANFTSTPRASGTALASSNLSKMTSSAWGEGLGILDITKESETEKLKRFFKYGKLQKKKS